MDAKHVVPMYNLIGWLWNSTQWVCVQDFWINQNKGHLLLYSHKQPKWFLGGTNIARSYVSQLELTPHMCFGPNAICIWPARSVKSLSNLTRFCCCFTNDAHFHRIIFFCHPHIERMPLSVLCVAAVSNKPATMFEILSSTRISPTKPEPIVRVAGYKIRQRHTPCAFITNSTTIAQQQQQQ